MKRALKTLILTSFFVLILSGCEGAEGPPGLVGPQGPAGPQGPPVVVSVVTFTLTATGFSNSGSIEGFTRKIPEITADVVSSGAVLAYTDLGSGGSAWTALPFSLATGGLISTLTFGFSTGSFSVIIVKNTNLSLASVYAGQLIRVVVIPPVSVSVISRVDTADYQAVRQALGLY